jgi:NitT/TauT family transport system substrate-binding protein
MTLRKNCFTVLFCVSLAVAAVAGGYLSVRSDARDGFIEGDNPNVPTLTFYTSSMATTPQLAFWAALRKGEFRNLFNVRVRLWRNTDDLQSVILAGKGDIWLGHTDGFALAKTRGAPVVLLAITGWRKFYIVATDPRRRGLDALARKTVAYAPPGSPAVAILRRIMGDGFSGLRLQAYQGRELEMLLMDGRVEAAIVPEPIVSMLLARNGNLRVVGSLEDIYGAKTGGPPRLPIAGIAVNANTAAKHPGIVDAILSAMLRSSAELGRDPAGAVKYLPSSFGSDIPQSIVLESMSRDIIFAKRAAEAEQEIAQYLEMALASPSGKRREVSLGRGFLWGK